MVGKSRLLCFQCFPTKCRYRDIFYFPDFQKPQIITNFENDLANEINLYEIVDYNFEEVIRRNAVPSCLSVEIIIIILLINLLFVKSSSRM